MKHVFVSSMLVIGAIGLSIPAYAQDTPSPKGPPKTMGDTGKLPATGAVGGAVPDMSTNPGDAPGAGPKKMGDEGKLPATGTVGGAVPTMTPPAGK